jgi:vacuolar-type H+-ATPase subunit H
MIKDVITSILEAEKKAEEIIKDANAKASDMISRAKIEAEDMNKEIKEKLYALEEEKYARAQEEGSAEAEKIISEGKEAAAQLELAANKNYAKAEDFIIGRLFEI